MEKTISSLKVRACSLSVCLSRWLVCRSAGRSTPSTRTCCSSGLSPRWKPWSIRPSACGVLCGCWSPPRPRSEETLKHVSTHTYTCRRCALVLLVFSLTELWRSLTTQTGSPSDSVVLPLLMSMLSGKVSDSDSPVSLSQFSHHSPELLFQGSGLISKLLLHVWKSVITITDENGLLQRCLTHNWHFKKG